MSIFGGKGSEIYKGSVFEKGSILASIRYTTFNGVYKRRWKDILQFRQKSLFSQCEVCWTLKSQLNSKTLSLDQKLGCLHQYREHLHDQFCDRSVIWKLQAESADPNTDFVIISTDGLDQSKFTLPRDPHLKASAALSFELISTFFLSSNSCFFSFLQVEPLKLIGTIPIIAPMLREKHQRPRVKVHGAWAFGYTLNVYVMDEPSPHDSSAIIEIVAATIEDATRFLIL